MGEDQVGGVAEQPYAIAGGEVEREYSRTRGRGGERRVENTPEGDEAMSHGDWSADTQYLTPIWYISGSGGGRLQCTPTGPLWGPVGACGETLMVPRAAGRLCRSDPP